MNEDPAKRPKFDMIVPILEKMQDKWTSCALLSWNRYLTPNGGVVLTSIALNCYSAAAFNATIASVSKTNSSAITLFFVCVCICWMWYQVVVCVFFVHCLWHHKNDYNLCFNLNWITCGGQYDSKHGFTEIYFLSGGGFLLKSRPVWGKMMAVPNLSNNNAYLVGTKFVVLATTCA